MPKGWVRECLLKAVSICFPQLGSRQNGKYLMGSTTPPLLPLQQHDTSMRQDARMRNSLRSVCPTENGLNFYSADVNKTGYWNFATYFDIEEAELSFQSENNSILPYTKVEINSINNNYNLSLNKRINCKFVA